MQGSRHSEMNHFAVGYLSYDGVLDDEWMVDTSYICAADFVHNAHMLTSGSTLRVEFSSSNTNDGFKCYLDGKLVEEQCKKKKLTIVTH